MQPVLNVEDIREVEQRLTQEGVSLAELMRRAGNACASEVERLEDISSVVILAGFGNNGGDGWVAAKKLKEDGYSVVVVSPMAPASLKGTLAPLAAQKAVEAEVKVVVGPARDKLDELLLSADVVLDAMLGTGFHGEPKGPFDIWIDCLNASGTQVIAVDVPSGLSAQTGEAPGSVVIADMTVTMLALKPGLLSGDGRDATGSIVVAPLAEQTEQLVLDADPVAWRTEAADYLDVLEAPSSNVDKFSRGSVLVVGGSARFPGAALMAARAAARAGAGYVTLAVPQLIVPTVQTHVLEIPVVGLPADDDGTFSAQAASAISEQLRHADCVVAGPGMRVTSGTVALCSKLLGEKIPLVLDADALNCLARLTDEHLDDFPEIIRRQAPLVLTPHRGELGRLVGLAATPPTSLTSALDAARRIVWASGGSELCVVAKGNATACVSVEAALLPKPGPAALATAGSGDVLAGALGALIARSHENTDSLALLCALGCEIHGAAGSIAAQRYGSSGVLAGDIIEALGLAADLCEERAVLPAAEELA